MLKWYECTFPVQWVQPPKRSLLQTRRCPKIKRKSWRRKRNVNRNSSRNRCNSWRSSIWSRIHARWAGGGWRQHRFDFTHHGQEKIPAVLTLNMLNCFEDCKDVFTFLIMFWVLFSRRPNSQCNKLTCCISYTVNATSADALASQWARASAGMLFIK